MTNGLVRTTSYYEIGLLNQLKKLAIDENKNLYELLNEAAKVFLETKTSAMANTQKSGGKSYADFIGPPLNVRLKKKVLTRKDFYE